MNASVPVSRVLGVSETPDENRKSKFRIAEPGGGQFPRRKASAFPVSEIECVLGTGIPTMVSSGIGYSTVVPCSL